MYYDRIDAAQKLASKIPEKSDYIVLAIPRGGVVLGDIIAKKLNCKLDVVISKKITPPDSPEYAIGAIAHDGSLYQTPFWSKFCNDPRFEHELNQKQNEIKRRLETYRQSDSYSIEGKSVILVDDGIATGSTVFAILNWLKKVNPKKIILAIPVMPLDTFEKMKKYVDEIIVLDTPDDFIAVGNYYENFPQISDSKVIDVLKKYQD